MPDMTSSTQQKSFRPPATPLVTCDPYFSIWSTGDHLTDVGTTHWTGTPNSLCGLVRVDGTTYRVIGALPSELPALPQRSLRVLPTQTVYTFRNEQIALTLTFFTPLFPHDLEVLARPVTYLTWEVRAVDGQSHAVALYFDATAELTVNTPDQRVVWSRESVEGLRVLRMGSEQQPVLATVGDNVRIDWGYLYLAAPHGDAADALAAAPAARTAFAAKGTLPADDLRMPRATEDETPALAMTLDLGTVGATPVTRHLLLAYDDLYSIEYFHQPLRPYWRRNGMEVDALLRAAERDYPALVRQAQAYDEEILADVLRVGGEQYAQVAALAFRQSLAAHKLVADADGTPLFFSKENFSNGCMATVDVTYPTAPFLLLFNPVLLKGSVKPVLDYAGTPDWPFPYAPHDLGTYPKANGQVYGGGTSSEADQMPVEECGNMLLLCANLAMADGNTDFVEPYWPLLCRWAEYLKAQGLDPANQLCTDDFAGHLAHNVNLSLKAIVALGAYALMCDMRGLGAEAEEYRRIAASFAQQWMVMADEGDHYRLAFDQPNTWSQKYNLVWDGLLDLNLFPAEVGCKEIAFYLQHQNRFGLPLDSRHEWTKLDWIVWTATLAESSEDFQALIAPIYAFLNESPSRVPMTDWYLTIEGKQVGFQARSVVGGVYLPILAVPALREKWSSRVIR